MLHLLPATTPGQKRRQKRAQALRQATAGARRKEHAAASPNGAKLAYMVGLRRIITAVWADMVRARIPARQDARDDLRVQVLDKVQRSAPSLIGDIGRRVSKHNLREQGRLLGIDPRIDPGTGPVIDAFRQENVQLITNLTDDMLLRVEAIVKDYLGGRVEDLAQELEDGLGFATARANLIARDQTLKLNGDLTKVRQQNAGISEYVWTTSRDERVREEHAALDGQTFSWNVPPPPGHPGEDYQCRCTAYPVIPGLSDEDEG